MTTGSAYSSFSTPSGIALMAGLAVPGFSPVVRLVSSFIRVLKRFTDSGDTTHTPVAPSEAVT